MSLLKNLTPQGNVGPLLGGPAPQQWNPPFDNGGGPPGAGGIACVDTRRGEIRLDENSRVPGVPYWHCQVRPGDKVPGQSGERYLWMRPQPPYDFKEGGRLGTVGHYGISARWPANWTAPLAFGVFLEMKQQSLLSPTWALTTNIRNGTVSPTPEGSDNLKVFLHHIAGCHRGGTYAAGFDYGLDAPPILERMERGVWYDFIVSVLYSKGTDGWSKLSARKATDAAWTVQDVRKNEPTAMWDCDTGQVTHSYLAQGWYREFTKATQEISLHGAFYGDTFDSVAAMMPTAVAGGGRLNPRIVTDAAGTFLLIDRDPTSQGTYVYRDGKQVSRTFDPAKTKIRLEKAGVPPRPGVVSVRPIDAIDLGDEEEVPS